MLQNAALKQKDTGEYEISIYQDELTSEGIKAYGKRIKVAFPKLFNDKTKDEKAQWIILFTERLKENNFTDERLKDAVNFVTDNFASWNREPQISDFISFDKKVKFWNYTDLFAKYKESYYEGATADPIARYYTRVDVGIGQVAYVKKEDALKYKLTTWVEKKKAEKKEEYEPAGTFSELLKELVNTISVNV